MKGKKKKVAAIGAKVSKAGKQKISKEQKAADRLAKQLAKDQRRATKMERRRKEKRLLTREMWAEPAPADLVGTLAKPNHKSKYHSYFEFAENTEKKDKKLEFQVTNNTTPPPGFKFVPIGDPTLTNACKDLSRRHDAMIFIVSGSREEEMKISAHIFRIGYHFRESIVDEASEIVGETAIVNRVYDPNDVEPIPESQEEISKQADAAIRDLFPRIPHTDRSMVLEHAFKKGALFHGEPTVGLQPTIPLSRRVQLAVLAHIRHTHTRYDFLLRETTWMNARKVVEPICLDVLVKWRGDEETGRDQMEEILREVVVLTDSEESDDSTDDEDSSDEEGEVTSGSTASVSQPSSRNQHRPEELQGESFGAQTPVGGANSLAEGNAIVSKDKTAQRGFKRYQAAWIDALNRQQNNPRIPEAGHSGPNMGEQSSRRHQSGAASPYREAQHPGQVMSRAAPNVMYSTIRERPRLDDDSYVVPHQKSYQSWQQISARPANSFREEVNLRPATERPTHYRPISHNEAPSYPARDHGQPIAVRGSPKGHSLQDLLVPSIETASSDAANDYRRPDTQYEVLDDPKVSYPRRIVERAVHSQQRPPAPRQVFIINDDSPQIKRQRVVYEDDHGHFRPLPPRDQDLYFTAPHADSHLLFESSVQPRDFFVPRQSLSSQSSQRVYNDVQPSLGRPMIGERLPIYDAPPEPGSPNSLYGRYKRVESGANPMGDSPIQERMDFPQSYSANARESARRPVNADMAFTESDQGRTHQAQPGARSRDPLQKLLPAFHPPSESSWAHGAGPAVSHDGYRPFLNNFSEARTQSPLSGTRVDFTVNPERSCGSTSQLNYQPRYEERPSAPFMTLRPGEAGSPVRYREGSLHRQEEQLPIFPGAGQLATDRRRVLERTPVMRDNRPPPEGDSPTYIRTIRRPVIVLD